nr:hypothetical protein L204_03185 [Cryptococcus depauperatus CBS 7855]
MGGMDERVGREGSERGTSSDGERGDSEDVENDVSLPKMGVKPGPVCKQAGSEKHTGEDGKTSNYR